MSIIVNRKTDVFLIAFYKRSFTRLDFLLRQLFKIQDWNTHNRARLHILLSYHIKRNEHQQQNGEKYTKNK